MTHRSLLINSLVFLSVVATSVWTAPPVQAAPETITIAASTTLRDTFRRILPMFESQNKDITIRIIYGTSQNLLKQIEEGAPIDVFLPSWFEDLEQLEKKGFIIQGTKTVYAGTSLALITGTELPTLAVSAKDLTAAPIRHIAIGDPKTSSEGKVAAQFLTHSKLEPKNRPSQFVYAEHSKAIQDLVAKGDADIGVIYRTDAVSNKKVRVLDTAPIGSHQPVRYGVAAVWTAKNIPGAQEFISFLKTPQAQALLQEQGFDRISPQVDIAQRQEGQ
jgi:molybdate transport system substrate-binding protein